ncbi:LOB domain-containing protein 4-like [Magnolia sinica]|uniref:LOB domain-containing protein 4-like n=1 Tax=Magnolia sinica TaxID=86752 RepID=UPI00265B716D|nr:LOB domain-containing protein 4-like [Magnolia sinica]
MKTRPCMASRSSSKTNVPCAGCKLLRRRCTKDCIFVPHFPSTEPEKFAGVHRIFGASNVSKMLQDIPAHHRGDAVSSMVYEANARLKDPIYGCVASIASLQTQVSQLQSELAMALAETMTLRAQLSEALSAIACATTQTMDVMEDDTCRASVTLGQAYSHEPMIDFPHLVEYSNML